MNVADLIQSLPVELIRGSPATDISDVVEDSREVTPGCLFVARPGSRVDGVSYVSAAIERGAAAILLRPVDSMRPLDAPVVLSAVAVDESAALISERVHGEPSRFMRLVGITGTNGKTTIAHLSQHLLERGGHRCGLIGTVVVDDGRSRSAATMTTPPACDMSRLLGRMRRNGCTRAVMEVSSHALGQDRVSGLRFAAAVFTNLSGDHLDYHGTLEAYADAKARLFASLDADATAVVNIDDPAWRRMVDGSRASILRCSLERDDAECVARVGRETLRRTAVHMHGPWGTVALDLPFTGRHNVTNALQAVAAAWVAGPIDADRLVGALASSSPPPGRLECVSRGDDAIEVLIDYAHTDDALAHALGSLRPHVAGTDDRSLIVVFGCGGDRDRTKRPRMGAVAFEHADRLVVTSDNPRTEPPQMIIDEILAGVPPRDRSSVERFVDRGQAIEHAIATAADGDVVLIAGKGHEDYQIVGTERRPFDDRLAASAALANRRRSEACLD